MPRIAAAKASLLDHGVNAPQIGGGQAARRGRTEALTDFPDGLPTLAEPDGETLPPAYRPHGRSVVGLPARAGR